MVTLSGFKTVLGSPSDLAALRLDQHQSPKRLKRFHHHMIHHNNSNKHKQQQSATDSMKKKKQSDRLEEEGVFRNLILKETNELQRRQVEWKSIAEQLPTSSCNQAQLEGQMRHSLLSWMLKVCEHQLCQDDIFPLATFILDKFLLLKPQPVDTLINKPINTTDDRHILSESQQSNTTTMMNRTTTTTTNLSQNDDLSDDGFYCDEDELNLRQLVLFAASSLLLASKLRQTPRLSIAALMEFSADELPIELKREELIEGEMCILHTLHWDLASLVTPNDYLSLLLERCKSLWNYEEEDEEEIELENDDEVFEELDNDQSSASQTSTGSSSSSLASPSPTPTSTSDIGASDIELSPEVLIGSDTEDNNNDNNGKRPMKTRRRCDENRVRRHTQTLIELCLMDSHLSQYPSSILAMTTMAVAIDGLSMTEKTCWRLEEIVAEIHEATHKVNELKLMIDVAFQIENYVQKLLNSLT